MIKKTIASLLIMGTVFSTIAIKANAEVTNVSGWKANSDNTWSYTDTKGAYSNKWLNEDGKWYYFNENGKMAKGWVTVEGKKYYLSEKGEMLKGWFCIGGPWYLFDRQTGAFVN